MIDTVAIKNKDIQSKTSRIGSLRELIKSISHSSVNSVVVILRRLSPKPQTAKKKVNAAKMCEIE
jgi:hypothetical protein